MAKSSLLCSLRLHGCSWAIVGAKFRRLSYSEAFIIIQIFLFIPLEMHFCQLCSACARPGTCIHWPLYSPDFHYIFSHSSLRERRLQDRRSKVRKSLPQSPTGRLQVVLSLSLSLTHITLPLSSVSHQASGITQLPFPLPVWDDTNPWDLQQSRTSASICVPSPYPL